MEKKSKTSKKKSKEKPGPVFQTATFATG